MTKEQYLIAYKTATWMQLQRACRGCECFIDDDRLMSMLKMKMVRQH